MGNPSPPKIPVTKLCCLYLSNQIFFRGYFVLNTNGRISPYKGVKTVFRHLNDLIITKTNFQFVQTCFGQDLPCPCQAALYRARVLGPTKQTASPTTWVGSTLHRCSLDRELQWICYRRQAVTQPYLTARLNWNEEEFYLWTVVQLGLGLSWTLT